MSLSLSWYVVTFEASISSTSIATGLSGFAWDWFHRCIINCCIETAFSFGVSDLLFWICKMRCFIDAWEFCSDVHIIRLQVDLGYERTWASSSSINGGNAVGRPLLASFSTLAINQSFCASSQTKVPYLLFELIVALNRIHLAELEVTEYQVVTKSLISCKLLAKPKARRSLRNSAVLLQFTIVVAKGGAHVTIGRINIRLLNCLY